MKQGRNVGFCLDDTAMRSRAHDIENIIYTFSFRGRAILLKLTSFRERQREMERGRERNAARLAAAVAIR